MEDVGMRTWIDSRMRLGRERTLANKGCPLGVQCRSAYMWLGARWLNLRGHRGQDC